MRINTIIFLKSVILIFLESYSLPGHFIEKPSEKPSDDAKKDFGNITSEFTDISSTVGN